jgi:poly(hydroxyalkanoate) depolymerase family esterase
MHQPRLTTMMAATRLTRQGRLAEATALLRAGSLDEDAPRPFVQPSVPPPPPRSSRQRPGPIPGGAASATLQDLLSRLQRQARAHSQGSTHAAPPLPGQWLHGSYTNRAGQRQYRLYVPSGHSGQPVPLITMLHGGTQTADDFAAGTGMNELAERHTFLVVYPEQSANANPMRYWNWFERAHQHRDTGEPSLIAGITRHVAAEHAIDGARVYVAGFSAGAAMSAVMAACYPDVYAAVGVHSGLAYGVASDVASAFDAMKHGAHTRSAAGTAPLIIFHGDADRTVHPVNAQCLVDVWLRASGEPASRYEKRTHSAQIPHGHRYERTTFTNGEGRPLVERWSIHGGGHAWSGGSPLGSYTDPLGPNASAELLRFFLHHTNVAVSQGRPRRRSSALRA